MSTVTQGEAIVLAASLAGVNPEDADGAVIIIAMKDGSVGIAGTGECECGTLEILGRAIERIAAGLHAGGPS